MVSPQKKMACAEAQADLVVLKTKAELMKSSALKLQPS
jgi:hypothetical protein